MDILLSSVFLIFGLRQRYMSHLAHIDLRDITFGFLSFWETDGIENKPKTSFILKDKNGNKKLSHLLHANEQN